jgi:hypothetical protein
VEAYLTVRLESGFGFELAGLWSLCVDANPSAYLVSESEDIVLLDNIIELTLNNAMTSAKKGGALTAGCSCAVLSVTFGSSPWT